MIAKNGFDEIAALLADMDPARLISTKASKAFQERMDILLDKNQDGEIAEQERLELEHCVLINRIFTQAKLKAFAMLNQ